MAKKDHHVYHRVLAHRLGLESTRLGPNRIRRSLQSATGWFSESEARAIIAHYAPDLLDQYDKQGLELFLQQRPPVPVLQQRSPAPDETLRSDEKADVRTWLKSLDFIWGGL